MVSRSLKAKAATALARAKALKVRRRKDGSREIKYTLELAQEICARIGRGEIWSRICGTDGMPEYSTLYRWRDKYPEFAEAWALAKAAAKEVRADEVLAVSMEATR